MIMKKLFREYILLQKASIKIFLFAICILAQPSRVSAKDWWQAAADFGNGPFELKEVPTVLHVNSAEDFIVVPSGKKQGYHIRVKITYDGRLKEACIDKSCINVEKLFPDVSKIHLHKHAFPDGSILEVKGIGRVVGVAFPVKLPPAPAIECLLPIPWAQGMPSRVVFFWREDGRLVEIAAMRPFELRGTLSDAVGIKREFPRLRCLGDKVEFRFFDVTPDF